MEIQSISSSHVDLEQTGLPANVTTALEKEVKTFERREQLISDLQVNYYPPHFATRCCGSAGKQLTSLNLPLISPPQRVRFK